ncbi:hypothetical protein WN51_10255 [Melipona quadrifasciata]|uniref:Uncharacterized protein n=1 Tax=Melipona quadrifasciata TaxID=166423 RepID=A0A0M9A4N6_9HYME|nr:hypothetical protein WN51_10255 [Melipona quadrifasciata]
MGYPNLIIRKSLLLNLGNEDSQTADGDSSQFEKGVFTSEESSPGEISRVQVRLLDVVVHTGAQARTGFVRSCKTRQRLEHRIRERLEDRRGSGENILTGKPHVSFQPTERSDLDVEAPDIYNVNPIPWSMHVGKRHTIPILDTGIKSPTWPLYAHFRLILGRCRCIDLTTDTLRTLKLSTAGLHLAPGRIVCPYLPSCRANYPEDFAGNIDNVGHPPHRSIPSQKARRNVRDSRE